MHEQQQHQRLLTPPQEETVSNVSSGYLIPNGPHIDEPVPGPTDKVIEWDADVQKQRLRKRNITRDGPTSYLKNELERMSFYEILEKLKKARLSNMVKIVLDGYEVGVEEVLKTLQPAFQLWYQGELPESVLREQFENTAHIIPIEIEEVADVNERSSFFRWLLLFSVVASILMLAGSISAYMLLRTPAMDELQYAKFSIEIPASSYQLTSHPKGVIVTYPSGPSYVHVVFNTKFAQVERFVDNNEMPVALTKIYKNATGYYYVNDGVAVHLGKDVHEVAMVEEYYPLFLSIDRDDSARLDIPMASSNQPNSIEFASPMPGVKDAIFSPEDGCLLQIDGDSVYRKIVAIRDGVFREVQEPVEYKTVERCSSTAPCAYEFVRIRAVLYGIISYPKAGPGRLTVQFFEGVDDTGYRIELLVHSTPTIVYNDPEKELMICQINQSILECKTYPMQIVYDWPPGNPA